MVNRRGWLRIVEAVISILIVFGAVLTVSTTAPTSRSSDICESLSPILDEIARNITLRSEILGGTTKGTDDFLANRVRNPAIDREVKICELDGVCPHTKSGIDNVEICASERVISSTLAELMPKKLKVFLFKK